MEDKNLYMIQKAQEFMNENHFADVSRVQCLLRKMMFAGVSLDCVSADQLTIPFLVMMLIIALTTWSIHVFV